MSEIYSALGAGYSATELKKNFRLLEQAQIDRLPEHGEPDLRNVFTELFTMKGIPCDEALARSMTITFRAISRQKLCMYEGVKETLQELRRRGKGIYLLSNAQSDFTRPELDVLGLTEFFDGILISSEEGCKKPAKEFYTRLFERFKLKPENCLMVGNDEFSDIAGAMKVGMDSLYIHTEISPDMTGISKATYAIMDGDWHKAAEIMLS